MHEDYQSVSKLGVYLRVSVVQHTYSWSDLNKKTIKKSKFDQACAKLTVTFSHGIDFSARDDGAPK